MSTSPKSDIGKFMVATGALIELGTTGKILLLHRAPDNAFHDNQWEVIYGRIAQHEDLEQGLRREVREETGITDFEILGINRTWHIYRGRKAAKYEVIGVTYHCRVQSDQVQTSKEHDEYRWVTPQEALELVQVEGIQEDIRLWETQYSATASSAEMVTKPKRGTDFIGVGVGALIQDAEGKILLAKRGAKAKNERGTWEVPGGGVEFGETLIEGLQREMKEELNIEIEVIDMVQVCDHILPDEKQHWVSPTYRCRIIGGTPTIMEPQKCDEIGWFTLEEASKLPLSKITKQDIEHLKSL
jgi:8-oxo-dGTP diphosphatase